MLVVRVGVDHMIGIRSLGIPDGTARDKQAEYDQGGNFEAR
jgi:hypothetical protein